MTTISEFNRRKRISKLLKQRKRAMQGNLRNSHLTLIPVPKVKDKTQKTMSASGGRKRALPQRLVNPQKAGSTLKKG